MFCQDAPPETVMNRFLALILALALSSVPVAALPVRPSTSIQFRATHEIMFSVADPDSDDGRKSAVCTASALGPHALLTAAHCDMGETSVQLDTVKVINYHILGRIKDGQDHEIFLVDGPEFKVTMGSLYTPGDYNIGEVGDEVFMFGDGGAMFPAQYRTGLLMGHVAPDKDSLPIDGDIFVYDMNIIGGDSGSAVYSTLTGKLVAIVTYGIDDHFMGAYPIRFTQDQVDQAEQFVPLNWF